MALATFFGANLLLIGVMVGVVHWLGRGVDARLESAEAAKALFLDEFPHARITEIVLTGPGDGALLALDERAVGVVAAMGMHWLVRLIEPRSIGAASVAVTGRLVLRLADFATPCLVLDLGSDARAAAWRDRLDALRETPSAGLKGVRA